MIVKYLAVSLPRRGPGGHILRGMRVVSTSSILLALPRIGPADTTQPPPGPSGPSDSEPLRLSLALRDDKEAHKTEKPKAFSPLGIYCRRPFGPLWPFGQYKAFSWQSQGTSFSPLGIYCAPQRGERIPLPLWGKSKAGELSALRAYIADPAP